jgi:MFS family permease
MSAYWFANSLKWFILLFVIAGQVERLVPGGEKGSRWGTVVMLGATWALIGPALFGFISDRFGSRIGKWRPFVALGASFTVIALMVLSGASSYSTIVLGYLLLQVSDDMAQGPYSSLIPALVPTEQRGRASGVMALLMSFAQIVGGVGALLLGSDVKAIYIFIAVTTAICALTTLATVREDPDDLPSGPCNFAEAWLGPWKNPDFTWVWFTRFLNALGFYLITTYLRYFLGDVVRDFHVFGFAVATPKDATPEAMQDAALRAVFVLSLTISLVAAISALIGGKLADTYGRKRVIYIAGVLMTLPLIPFVIYPNFTLMLLLAIPFAVGYGAYQSADWALASDVMPTKSALAKDMGLWQSSIAAPQIVSGAIGYLVDMGNKFRPGFGYTYTFLFASLSFAVSIVLVKQIRGST